MSEDIDLRKAHWSTRRRPSGAAAPATLAPQRPRFRRFAAAMAAARVNNAPHLSLYGPAPGSPPGPSPGHDLPGRVPRRPVVRWLGIGGCVLLLGLLVVIMLTQPIGAAMERLIGAGLGWQPEQHATAPRPAPIVPD